MPEVLFVFFTTKKQQFIQWWQRPITTKDRLTGAMVGAFGCFWIGGLGRLILVDVPVPVDVIFWSVLWWAFGCAFAGLVFGLIFPKIITCVCFPFSMINIG